jgi:chemotaxis protein CheY-P-specific phosphatase CheC
MNVGVESLGAVSRTAREGGERAARNLTGMTGIETTVAVSKVTLASAEDLAADARRVGVATDFEGGMDGASLLTISPEGVETLTETLLAGDGNDEDAVTEVGNVVTSGFIDEWADHLETIIDVSPPRYVEGTNEQLLDAVGFDRDRAFVFRTKVGAVGETLDAEFYLFPDRDSLREMLSDNGDIPVEKLTTLKRMARTGAETASESVSTMTGIDTRVDITDLSFVPVEDVPGELSDRKYVGVVLGFEAAPGGYVLILFDEASAREVVAALVPGGADANSSASGSNDWDGSGTGSNDSDGSGTGSNDPTASVSFDGLARSAMEEIGNVMTSSFVDGWANVLDTTIDISTPRFVHDMGSAVAESVVARLGRTQANAILFDATLRADDRAFDCEIYALPDETELRAMLDDLDPDASAERTTKSGSL